MGNTLLFPSSIYAFPKHLLVYSPLVILLHNGLQTQAWPLQWHIVVVKLYVMCWLLSKNYKAITKKRLVLQLVGYKHAKVWQVCSLRSILTFKNIHDKVWLIEKQQTAHAVMK